MSDQAFEVNFDGIVGPTHNYGGLSIDNKASQQYQNTTSNPRDAALQGLKKMKFVADLGVRQAVLPPQERPAIALLRKLGFVGSDQEVIERATQETPEIFQAVTSSSNMWTANAATISPSPDTADGRVHITPANLASEFHRSFEHRETKRLLQRIFADKKYFEVHNRLPYGANLSDEGAANHTRLCQSYGGPGIELFHFGRYIFDKDGPRSCYYIPRQSFEASKAVARWHQLAQKRSFFIQNTPEAIDAGVFHNDVISVGNKNVLLFHEKAFVNSNQKITYLKQRFHEVTGGKLVLIEAREHDFPLKKVVSSYLFNSQLLSPTDKKMVMLCPHEVEETPEAMRFLESFIGNSPVSDVHFLNLTQSMRNGGGPACLRLRVVLTEEEWNHINPHVILTDELYNKLVNWVKLHYRDKLDPEDLSDPVLLDETRAALDDLSTILHLGSVYDFQESSQTVC